MHDGCSARTFVRIEVAGGLAPFELAGAGVFGSVPGLPRRLAPGSCEHAEARASGAVALEPLGRVRLAPEHNEIPFFTWAFSSNRSTQEGGGGHF